MYTSIRAELQKARRRHDLIVCLLVPVMALLWCQSAAPTGADELASAYSALFYSLPIINTILMPLAMAILASRLWDVEVKGCTLEIDGIGYFPDAPTERGVKHLHELAQAQRDGYQCAVAFVIQMEGITEVRPNIHTQPEFGAALTAAKKAGVQVLFLLCRIERDTLEIIEQREG